MNVRKFERQVVGPTLYLLYQRVAANRRGCMRSEARVGNFDLQADIVHYIPAALGRAEGSGWNRERYAGNFLGCTSTCWRRGSRM